MIVYKEVPLEKATGPLLEKARTRQENLPPNLPSLHHNIYMQSRRRKNKEYINVPYLSLSTTLFFLFRVCRGTWPEASSWRVGSVPRPSSFYASYDGHLLESASGNSTTAKGIGLSWQGCGFLLPNKTLPGVNAHL